MNLMFELWAIGAESSSSQAVAISANRAGAVGVVQFRPELESNHLLLAIGQFRQKLRHAGQWGLQVDLTTNAQFQKLVEAFAKLNCELPLLLLNVFPSERNSTESASELEPVEVILTARSLAQRVAVVVGTRSEFDRWAKSGVDALVIRQQSGTSRESGTLDAPAPDFPELEELVRQLPPDTSLLIDGGWTLANLGDRLSQGVRGVVLRDEVVGTREQPADVAHALAQEHVTVAGVLEATRKACLGTGTALDVVPKRLRPRTPDDDIAIVGLAGLFPQAGDVRTFWRNILGKLDAIVEIPEDRWRIDDYFDADRRARDKVYSKWGGFLGEVRFDPLKWSMPPASVASIDAVQLLSLEVAYSALLDAGYSLSRFKGEHASVIFAAAGIHDMSGDYFLRSMLPQYLTRTGSIDAETRKRLIADLEDQLIEWTEDSFPGFLLNVISGRIANRLDFHGSNYTVDAACAASMAGVHAAVQQLRMGTSDAVLVGSTDVTNNPFCYMSFAKTHALSPRGRSRPFDATSDGIALGEAVCAALLKRLPDAERDGDRVYAVIKGVGASSDGRRRSMTAPCSEGQMRAVHRAYADAEFEPASVKLIEAHGTGTAVGDATEVKSVSTVFRQAQVPEKTVALGSVKSMMGHAKVSAGLVSLIKTSLALHHKILPATIGVEQPHPEGRFDDSPLYINKETRPWLRRESDPPRRAGVSAFGFGGTNFHIALEEYTGGYRPCDRVDLSKRPAEVFLWSASDAHELAGPVRRIVEFIGQHASVQLDQLAASHAKEMRASYRSDAPCRLAVVATSIDDLLQKLERAATQLEAGQNATHPSGVILKTQPAVTASEVCFLYPGQGSQGLNMLDWLFRWSADARETVERAEEAYLAAAGENAVPLHRRVFPPPVFCEEERLQQQAALDDTAVAQPALGLVEMAATQWLARAGITANAFAGHSYGEYVALWAAGVFTDAELMRLSARRGELCARATAAVPGAMASVAASAADVQAAIAEHRLNVHIANRNAPDQTVVGGPQEAIEQACQALAGKGWRVTPLAVTAAFHTPMLQETSTRLAEEFHVEEWKSPRTTVGSNTLGSAHGAEPTAIARLLGRHLVEPVQWVELIEHLSSSGTKLFIEVGPKSVLTRLTQRILTHARLTGDVVSLDNRDRPDGSQAAHLLAACAAHGLPVDLQGWIGDRDLKDWSLDAYGTELTRQATVKPTEWILTPSRSRPVRPLIDVKPSADFTDPKRDPRPHESESATDPKQHSAAEPVTTSVAESASPAPRPAPIVSVGTSVALAPAAAPLPLAAPRSRVANSIDGGGPAPAALNGHAIPAHSTNGHPTSNGAASANGHALANGNSSSRGAGTANHQTADSSPSARSVSSSAAMAAPPEPTDRAAVPEKSLNPSRPARPVATASVSPKQPVTTAVATPRGVSSPMTISTRPSSPIPKVTMPMSAEQFSTPVNPTAQAGATVMFSLIARWLEVRQSENRLMERFLDLYEGTPGNPASIAPALFQELPTAAWLPPAAPAAIAAPAPVVEHATVAEQVSPPAPANPYEEAPGLVQRLAQAAPGGSEGPRTSWEELPRVEKRTLKPQSVLPAAPKSERPKPVAAPRPAPAAAVAAPAPAPAPAKPAAAPASQPATVASVAVATVGGDVPTTEAFRADLLQVTSARTGYPIETLDETLPLEAGLGIDSIKTVEIFSKLKKYHPYLLNEGEDEDEVLAEFAKLQTLGDIVQMYDRRRGAHVNKGGASPAPAKATTQSEHSVERYTVVAEEAHEGAKKKSGSPVAARS